jgi:hypothetical protein
MCISMDLPFILYGKVDNTKIELLVEKIVFLSIIAISKRMKYAM